MIAATPRSLLGLAVVVWVAVAGVQAVGGWSRERLGAQVAAEARPGDIQMIGSVTCVYCDAARTWLQHNRVPFKECLIEREPACAAAYQATGAPGTPVVWVRGKRLLGFSAQAIADALNFQ